MPPNLFFDLPRELRDQIYIYALSSPTGYVFAMIPAVDLKPFKLLPFHPPGAIYPGRIRLSLLQTCKQIHREAKGVIFEHNTWAILIISQLLWQFQELDASLSLQVRHIWLGIDFTDRDLLRDTARALHILSEWVCRGGEVCRRSRWV